MACKIPQRVPVHAQWPLGYRSTTSPDMTTATTLPGVRRRLATRLVRTERLTKMIVPTRAGAASTSTPTVLRVSRVLA